VRGVLLLLLLITGGGLLMASRRIPPEPPRLTWVATAQQYGPVGYRDPAGAISPDGRWIAYSEGRFLRVRPIDGGPDIGLPAGDAQIRRLEWSADGRTIVTDGAAAGAWARFDRVRGSREPLTSRPALQETPIALPTGLVSHGPLAVSPDRTTIYFAAANDGGTVDLWSVAAAGGAVRRLTSFSGDTYAPSVAADGTVLFKVQSYRTVVARAVAGGGPSEPLADFRSETPSWHPGGALVGITYGTWRRLIDDAKYPDIAQEAGIIRVEDGRVATKVAQVVDDSDSEDQSLCWSPNGRWIAYHSHKEQSDDVWLRPADGSTPGRRISFLGRGAETGWPRWSADGRWLLFDGAAKRGGESAIHVIGVDQDAGVVTRDAQRVEVRGLDAEVSHAEWVGAGSETIAAVAKEGPGRHVIFTVPRAGGLARIVHRMATEHDAPGLGVSPDGRHVAFIAPAADGYFQVFRMPLAGGAAVQVTQDPSHKTQPAWSPDGRMIAFTVWSYEAQFWSMKP
jgi:Tol biopolymer transport system component